jgi:hypothetical protein
MAVLGIFRKKRPDDHLSEEAARAGDAVEEREKQ